MLHFKRVSHLYAIKASPNIGSEELSHQKPILVKIISC